MENLNPINPPTWPLKFLRFFLKKEYLEEIEGDMEEMFYENVEHLSLKKARRIYAWEILGLVRPVLIKNLEVLQRLNHLPMFKNYFKVSLRGLLKNPVNSFINIFGLSAAIGYCIFAYAFTNWVVSTDQFHEHKDAVYLVTFSANRDGTATQYGTTPRPLGEMLRQDFAHIEKVCRIQDKNAVLKNGDNVFHERVRFVDPEFLEMFTFPMKWGTARSLKDVNSIVLSENMSVKYFGEENPIGQTILMIVDKERSKAFKITGVAKHFPEATSFEFEFLVNFDNLKTYDPGYDPQDWNAFVNATFIQVDSRSALESIGKGMEKYRKLQNEAVQPEWAITSFGFESLATLHKRTEDVRDDIAHSSQSNYISIIFMGVVGAFLLSLACFNYINIAIASAAKRLKEIGVRKSIGATRGVVIIQFLSENIVITTFALFFGLVLGMTFFIPGFEILWKFSMGFTLNEPALWIFLPAIVLVTSVASGIYPSLYISRFQVVNIMKGSVKFGQRNPLTKIFLCAQLILCCVFITCSVLFTQNTHYLTKRSWGYDNAQTMYAKVPDRSAYEKLNAMMAESPDVQLISGSLHHVGKSNSKTIIHFPDRDVEVDQLAVDAKYFETMGLHIQQGRGFIDHENSDRHAAVVNESLVRNLSELQAGWEHPIGKTFRLDSTEFEVVGVLRDFHNYSFNKMLKPIIFTIAEKENYGFLSLKVAKGTELKTYKALQANWAKLFPETPFDGGLQRDAWGFYYESIGIYDLVWKVVAFLAVSLATLGLYGLIRLNVAGRVKEFSIRKVLGAGLKNLAVSIVSQYWMLFSAALIIGAPAGYILSKWLIEFAYVYHMPITFSGVTIGVGIMVLVLLFTVSTQIRKVVKANPVDGLKTE
jgi:putative ABC transport system permease protein